MKIVAQIAKQETRKFSTLKSVIDALKGLLALWPQDVSLERLLSIEHGFLELIQADLETIRTVMIKKNIAWQEERHRLNFYMREQDGLYWSGSEGIDIHKNCIVLWSEYSNSTKYNSDSIKITITLSLSGSELKKIEWLDTTKEQGEELHTKEQFITVFENNKIISIYWKRNDNGIEVETKATKTQH